MRCKAVFTTVDGWTTRCSKEMFHALDYDEYIHQGPGPRWRPWRRIEWVPRYDGPDPETDRNDVWAWKE